MNDEEKVVKEALRKKYFEDITQELNKELAKKQIQSLRNVRFDEEGNIQFSSIGPIQGVCQELGVVINYLASELCNRKVDLWFENHKPSKVC